MKRKKITTLLLAMSLVLSWGIYNGRQTNAASLSEDATKKEQDTDREMADENFFELSEDEEKEIKDLIFEEDVTVSGEKAQITFVNCEFKGDIINTANEGTRVVLNECEMEGKCIFQNDTKECTMEWSFPKFLVDSSVETVCEDCIGSVIALGDFEMVFNDETYSMEDSELFFDLSNPKAGFVPYEGQEAGYYCIAQWWENDEKRVLVECEYDPEM